MVGVNKIILSTKNNQNGNKYLYLFNKILKIVRQIIFKKINNIKFACRWYNYPILNYLNKYLRNITVRNLYHYIKIIMSSI